MKLLSKKEVQTLRSQAIDRSNLEKSKVDQALSANIRAFNDWKTERSQEEYKIEQEFHNKINRYNAQIDDLVKEVAQLQQQKAYQLIPVTKLMEEARIKMREVETKRSECEKMCKSLDEINKKNKEASELVAKREKLLAKRELLVDSASKRALREQEATKLGAEKLFKAKIDFENEQVRIKAKNDDKLDEIRIKSDEIKAQIAVNREQKLQNMRDQSKIISDRQALNTAWEELKKLKEKYDRR